MYFVTLCVKGKRYLFGRIAEEVVDLFRIGKIVKRCWEEIPGHFKNVTLDEFVMMPNHLHGIVVVGATHASPLRNSPQPGPKPRSLGSIVGSFKSAVTRRVNRMRTSPGSTFWQRNYYEHVVRNEKELNLIRQYIMDNPLKWETDRENPAFEGIPRQDEIRDILGDNLNSGFKVWSTP
jgi:REP element-mobilizing transposase RayT